MRKTENRTWREQISHAAVHQAWRAGAIGLLLVLAGQSALAQSGNPLQRLFGLEPKQEEQAAPPEQAAPAPQPDATPVQQPLRPPMPPRRPAATATQTTPTAPAPGKPAEHQAVTGAKTPFGIVFRPLDSNEFVPFSQPEPMQLQPKPLPGKAGAPAPAAPVVTNPAPSQPELQPSTSLLPSTAPEQDAPGGEQPTVDAPLPGHVSLPSKAPLPPPAPKRPASSPEAASADPADAPLPSTPGANVPAPAALPPASTLTDRQIIERANRYFNITDTLQANFTQLAGGSQRTTGTLYLERPGKIRFAYNPPSTMEIVSDGKSVAIRDSKLNTSDVYSINQTPLKFLLRDPINLGTDLKVVEIERDPTSIQITLEDAATIGGKAQITLYFDSQMQNLTRWQIVDAQGFLTTVILSQVKRARRPE